MWIACSPAVRFLRSSAIFAPLPPGPSESFAVPTSFPAPSFNVTLTGLFSAISAVPNSTNAAIVINVLVNSTSLRIFESSHYISALFLRVRLIDGGAKALRELHRIVVGPEVHEEQPGLLVEH